MSLNTMENRLRGGRNQQDRMEDSKFWSLKGALADRAYQKQTAVLSDGREFACLINGNKLSGDYHDKIISIPYKDVCLNKPRQGKTSEGLEEIGLKPGDVFTWKETNTDWLVYLKYIEENAYMRADIRECTATADINGTLYRVYAKGPSETDLVWQSGSGNSVNKMNYSLIMYITKNEETLDFFRRFTIVKVDGKRYKAAVVNRYFANGVLRVCLDEWFEENVVETKEEPPVEEIDETAARIIGSQKIKPYGKGNYSVANISGGTWKISNKKAKIKASTELSCTVEVLTGKSGEFELIYQVGEQEIKYPITILSL